MRRGLVLLAAMGLSVPVSIPASAGTSVDIGVTIGGAPPPPVIVVREEPRVVVVPGSSVYVVRDRHRYDYDVFRYGVYWYVYNDGYWYRARWHRGPYRHIRVKYVPRAILAVPAKHWKRHPHGGPPGLMRHGGPPGLMKKRHDRDHEVVVIKEKRRGRRD
jgi:hypothetical protein